MKSILKNIPKYNYFRNSEQQAVSKKLNKVYLDVSAGPSVKGRVVIKLFNNIVPKTAENFRQIAIGAVQNLNYKNSELHKVVPGLLIQGGDVNGKGGASIYGQTFADESFALSHDRAGLVSMVNNGPDTNGSQFFITLGPSQWLDYKNVVFGEVVEGMQVLAQVEKLADANGKPTQKVVIEKSGEL